MMGGPAYIRVRLKYPDLDTFIERYSPRLTAKGLFLVVRSPSPPGTLVHFELVLLSGSTALAGKGEVTWVRPFSDQRGFHGMVIKFLSLDPGSDAILTRVLAAKEEPRGDSFDPKRIAEDTLPDDQIDTTPFISPRKLLPNPAEPKTSRRALPEATFPVPPRLPAPAPDWKEPEDSDKIDTRRAPRLPDEDEAATLRAKALSPPDEAEEPIDDITDAQTGDSTRQYQRPESNFLSSFKTSTHIRIYTRAMPKTPEEQDAELERLAEESGLADLRNLVSWAKDAIRGTPRDPASIERELVALAIAAKKD